MTEYNRKIIKEESRNSWSNQYCESIFPRYWYEVFKVSESLDKDLRVLEVGTGHGDITSIFCYLGFKDLISFERDEENAKIAQKKLKSLFSVDSIVRQESFPNSEKFNSDILVLVNCVYADGIHSKEEYKEQIMMIYTSAGCPRIFLFEVIDSEYVIPDKTFPYEVRLSKNDIQEMFPASKISGIRTYQYPKNKKTKTLYIIKYVDEYCNCYIRV